MGKLLFQAYILCINLKSISPHIKILLIILEYSLTNIFWIIFITIKGCVTCTTQFLGKFVCEMLIWFQDVKTKHNSRFRNSIHSQLANSQYGFKLHYVFNTNTIQDYRTVLKRYAPVWDWKRSCFPFLWINTVENSNDICSVLKIRSKLRKERLKHLSKLRLISF